MIHILIVVHDVTIRTAVSNPNIAIKVVQLKGECNGEVNAR